MYEPQSQRLKSVRSRISPESWEKRVEEAKAIETQVQKIAALLESGKSLEAALAKAGTGEPRSTVMRWLARYSEQGLEGLIDARAPRERKLTRGCRDRIEALRTAKPKTSVEEVSTVLEQEGMLPLPSKSWIKKEFGRIKSKRQYAMAKAKEATTGKTQVVPLTLAGGELLLAAEMETGVMAAITDEIVAIGKAAKEASGDQVPERDRSLRDRKGHFTARYNRARRRKPGEEIASHLRTSAEKAKGRVPGWARFTHESRDSIAAKAETLMLSWAVAETKGWDALRAPVAAGLAPLTRLAYMPSTLAKMTSALAKSRAGDNLLAAVGLRWHAVATQHWGEEGAVAALYVDNHVKEVWSSRYTLSGKVSHLNRVMPCITTTYVHTGAGAPIVVSVQSGSAPLAPRLKEIAESVQEQLGEEIRRAVVIDAEGSTFDVLESFVRDMKDETKSRIIVTPLRPSRAPELDIRHAQDAKYRPYRERGELRIGEATLTHKTTGRTLEIGTLEVKREHRESDTILLTNGLALGATGEDLADLYFERWPLQENFFKAAKPIGLAEHRTNCAEIVINVAVESKLERLGRRRQAAEMKIATGAKTWDVVEGSARDAGEGLAEATTELKGLRTKLDSMIDRGRCEGKEFGQAAVGHQVALARCEAATIANKRAQEKWEKLRAQNEKLTADVERIKKEEEKLRPLTKIRQLDMEPDKIFTAMKLALAMLITFALREYLPSMAMLPQTFLSRVMCLQGRREIGAREEVVIFYENQRDPEVTQALRAACVALNKRRLKRDDRSLHYKVEQAPDTGMGASQ